MCFALMLVGLQQNCPSLAMNSQDGFSEFTLQTYSESVRKAGWDKTISQCTRNALASLNFHENPPANNIFKEADAFVADPNPLG